MFKELLQKVISSQIIEMNLLMERCFIADTGQ